ncbi:hypothetical protein FGB62_170g07 [Gracilaria domingensis]|nr:hypothetical protein FGB62_170g07 [Gracilaria domingensis]
MREEKRAGNGAHSARSGEQGVGDGGEWRNRGEGNSRMHWGRMVSYHVVQLVHVTTIHAVDKVQHWAPFLWPRSQTPAAEISDALQRLAQWPACHPCIRTCSATKMCSPCPLPLPPHLEEKVREEQRQFMDNMKGSGNVIAYQRVPLPVKTGCKWTVEERKRNNSLSMKRSRVRNAGGNENYPRRGHIAASQIVPVNQSVQPVQNGQEVQGVVPPPQFSGDGAAEHLRELVIGNPRFSRSCFQSFAA